MENGERRQIRWYEVIYVVVLLALLVMSVFYMNPHKVAVLDVDRVFKEVGLVEKIEADRQKLDVFNRGQALVKAYNTRMSTLKSKLEEAKTQAEKEKIQSQIKSANETMQQTLAPIQNALQTHEGNVVTTFRRRLQPFIAKVAQKRRADVVIYAGPSLLYVKGNIDITPDVVKVCKEFFAKEMPLIDPAAGTAPGAAKK
jgi:Skp family chaperone for outer membrane proteins